LVFHHVPEDRRQPLPVKWSETETLKWKRKLPGPGSSSPVLVGKRVFITCWTGYGLDRDNPGDEKELRRHLICLDRDEVRLEQELDFRFRKQIVVNPFENLGTDRDVAARARAVAGFKPPLNVGPDATGHHVDAIGDGQVFIRSSKYLYCVGDSSWKDRCAGGLARPSRNWYSPAACASPFLRTAGQDR
jgi:hypothetical protein